MPGVTIRLSISGNRLDQVMTQKSLLAALTLSSLPGLAQDFAKGLAAFETGDYSTALEEWRPLAQQGNAKA